MTSNQITIALTKGRIEKDTVKLLEKAGFDMSFMADKGRNLIFESPDKRFRFLLVKAPDVTTYVRHGVADIGIVGKDVLVEHPTGYLEMLDLNFGRDRSRGARGDADARSALRDRHGTRRSSRRRRNDVIRMLTRRKNRRDGRDSRTSMVCGNTGTS